MQKPEDNMFFEKRKEYSLSMSTFGQCDEVNSKNRSK